ncbi:MAG: pantetheine-phosphate adenylyltransferase [Mucinivorans sp.]
MTAIFPGSFDPFTRGHEAIVRRALTIFDNIIIGVGVNTGKKGFLSPENRLCLIEDVFAKESRVRVKLYDSLTVDFARDMQATHIIRGLRNTTDMQYEQNLETLGRRLAPNIETVYIMTETAYVDISSSAIRELHHFGAKVVELMPRGIKLDNYL